MLTGFNPKRIGCIILCLCLFTMMGCQPLENPQETSLAMLETPQISQSSPVVTLEAEITPEVMPEITSSGGPDVGSENPDEVSDEQDLVSSMADFYRVYRSLRIQRKGDDRSYKAIEPLGNKIADMLSKADGIEMTVNECQGIDIDNGGYDYLLHFDGAKDIGLNLESGTYGFEGEAQRYLLWGDSKAFWDSLEFDATSETVALTEETVVIMTRTYFEDLDGDGREEKLTLSYESDGTESNWGTLYLRLGQFRESLLSGEDWFIYPYRTMGGMPDLAFLPNPDTGEKAAVVLYTWATNGVGSTGEAYIYRYENRELMRRDIGEHEITMRLMDSGIELALPELKQTFNVVLDAQEYSDWLNRQMLSSGSYVEADLFDPHILGYTIMDYNGDGTAEVCAEALLMYWGRT